MVVKIRGGGHPVKALLADAHFLQTLSEGLLAAQLLDISGLVLRQLGGVFAGHGYAVGGGRVLHHGIGQRVGFRLLLGHLAQGRSLQALLPLDGTVVVDQLAVHAIGAFEHVQLVLQAAAGVGQPVKIQLHGNLVAAELQGGLGRVNVQKACVDIDVLRGLVRGLIRRLAGVSAACAQAQDKDQG